MLSIYGYYDIINGKKENYVVVGDGKARYRYGICFEQVFSLFSLDHEIRNRVMVTMLESVAYVR